MVRAIARLLQFIALVFTGFYIGVKFDTLAYASLTAFIIGYICEYLGERPT